MAKSARLESDARGNLHVGSNPTPSARRMVSTLCAGHSPDGRCDWVLL